MKKRPTFTEQFGAEAEAGFKRGRDYQRKLDVIRKEDFNLETIYQKYDPELYEWWNREIP
jgi:hypothetical protein